MKDIITSNNESLIGTWTLNCIPFKGTKLLGKLHVTDKSLYFDAQFDSSLSGLISDVVTSAVAASGHALLVAPEIANQWKEKGYLQISKEAITKVSSKSSFFKKTATITIKDDSEVVFDYGMLSVKKLVEAIEQ
jgi:hypothetical protein